MHTRIKVVSISPQVGPGVVYTAFILSSCLTLAAIMRATKDHRYYKSFNKSVLAGDFSSVLDTLLIGVTFSLR